MNKTLIVMSLLFWGASFNTLATPNQNREVKTIETKCFVTLYGGKQTILYQIIKENHFTNLANKLTNSSTMTTLSDKKQKVYKVVECVKTSEEFNSQMALAVEKITPK